MLETLLGTLFGGAFRLVPEALKWLERKDERKHELAMFDKQLEADKLKAQSAQELAQVEANRGIAVGEIQALIEGAKAQAVPTGIAWVDAASSIIRPLLTFYWCIALYTTALVAKFVVLVQGGAANVQAVLMLWGADEKAIVASMISYWFLDRSLRKGAAR